MIFRLREQLEASDVRSKGSIGRSSLEKKIQLPIDFS